MKLFVNLLQNETEWSVETTRQSMASIGPVHGELEVGSWNLLMNLMSVFQDVRTEKDFTVLHVSLTKNVLGDL